ITSIDQSDANAGNGGWERDVRKVKCARSSGDGNDVRIIVRIGRDHCANNLSLVAEALRKQWPTWPVDQTAGQNFLLIWPSLASKVISWNTTGGIISFTVFHR